MESLVKDNSLLNASKEDGVKDLPMKVRAKFARALVAEREGRTSDAYAHLLDAIEAEKNG